MATIARRAPRPDYSRSTRRRVAARIAAVGTALPTAVRTSADVEARIRAASPNCVFRDGIVEALTGVSERRVLADREYGSDLAATAARRALECAGVDVTAVDLLIFASASQDLAEPATANIVQEKLGTACSCFDLKNACNSFIDAVGVAEGLIAAGLHERVLVAAGEATSCAIRWDATNLEELRLNFPGYTLGDGGAAVLVSRPSGRRGAILHRESLTVSRHWDLATIRGGGSMHPRGDEWTYIRGDASGLKEAFAGIGPAIVERALDALGMTRDDLARVLIHQVSLPFLGDFLDATDLPPERVERTLPLLGNMAAASLPVAYAQALERGLDPGDRVLWIGLAAGISVHVMVTEV